LTPFSFDKRKLTFSNKQQLELSLTMAPQNSVVNVLSPTKLAHVVLKTSQSNFHAMCDFYKKFLGAHAVFENGFLCFLTYDDEHHRIAIAALPGIQTKDATSAGLEV
jgi:catechol-2,3-dioxygenase